MGKNNLSKFKTSSDKKSIVLPMFMYFDDFETGDPLGSHSGTHKLGAVYINIAAFPPKYRSMLKNIFLALLFHSNDKKFVGNEAIITILIQELAFLETEGITVGHSEGTVQVYLVLTLILGFNLGLHSIMGLSESFSGNFSCRFCKIDKQTAKIQIKADPNLLRNSETYD